VKHLDFLEVPLSATISNQPPQMFTGSRGEYRAHRRSTRARPHSPDTRASRTTQRWM